MFGDYIVFQINPVNKEKNQAFWRIQAVVAQSLDIGRYYSYSQPS
jgi:hypothetical protein